MLLRCKHRGAENVFHEYRLEDVLRVGVVFQMDHAQPPHGVGVPVHGPDRLLFAPHGMPLISCYLFQQPP